MKAVSILGPGEVRFGDHARPDPAGDEVLVRVAYAGICKTDVRLVAEGRSVGLVPGHEAVGWTGSGEVVGIHPDVGCGRCLQCSRGYDNRCPERRSVGVDRDGALAELVAVPVRHLVPLGGVELHLAPLLEPLACCVHALDMLGPIAGEPALVVGAGPMGLLNLLLLRAAGARVAVSARSPRSRDLAMSLGADVVVGAGESPNDSLGEPPRVAVVAVGTQEALSYAVETVDVGSTVHVFAGIRPEGQVDANTIHYRQLRVVGSSGSRVADYRQALKMVADGEVDLGALPVEVMGLEAAPGVLDGSTPVPAKVLIEMEERKG